MPLAHQTAPNLTAIVKRILSILTFLFICLVCNANAVTPQIDIQRSRVKAKQALLFAKQRGYNTRYCILTDMSLPSGVRRFMVWDFKRDTILISGLVSHGCGNSPWSGVWSKDKPAFSNADGSHCTALGKYLIGKRGHSSWGIHVNYQMAGLEATNSNAMARQIVFHSWDQVTDAEVYPNGTPEGWGCPAISNKNMKAIDTLIRKQSKHMLLWIYN